MTKSIDKPGDPSRSPPPSNGGPSTGRRALLVAMPTIFSLRQGVAAEMARTSAVLVRSETKTAYCAKDPGLGGNEKGWFIGPETKIQVSEFTSSTYCKATTVDNKTTYSRATRAEICDNGGVYYVPKSGGDCNAQGDGAYTATPNVGKGAFVSFVALGSFANVHIDPV